MDANSYLEKKEKLRKLDVMMDLMYEQMAQLAETMEAVKKAAKEDLSEDRGSLSYMDRIAIQDK